jgi:pSer/pThr/pTyr-binding forkhead associated (FHA) protein
MPPQLQALTEGPNILLDKPILLLGRHQECDIQLGSRKVSRRHCCLAQVNDHFVVRDLGSTNGIRINGVRVLEGSLIPGDELTIGNQRYQLNWESRTAKAPPAKSPVGEKPPVVHQPARPQSRPTDHEASLESADQPVPIAETSLVGQIPFAAVLRPAVQVIPADPNASAEILPDQLQLKPLTREGPAPAS